MKKNNIYVITGQSACGKDTVVSLISDKLENELGVKRLVRKTTRPMRDNETDGVEYHFRTNEDYDNETDPIIEEEEYIVADNQVWRYYSTVSDYNSDTSLYTIASPEALKNLSKCIGSTGRLKPIIIRVNDRQLLIRALSRNNDSVAEIIRRFEEDNHKYKEYLSPSSDILKDLEIMSVSNECHDASVTAENVYEYISRCENRF